MIESSFDEDSLLNDLSKMGNKDSNNINPDTLKNNDSKSERNLEFLHKKNYVANNSITVTDDSSYINNFHKYNTKSGGISDNTSTLSSVLRKLENRLLGYLQLQIKRVISDIIYEIDNSLRETDSFNGLVDVFISELTDNIKEYINFANSRSRLPNGSSMFDSFQIQYKEIYKDVYNFLHRSPYANLRNLNGSKDLISTWPNVLKKTFSCAYSEFVNSVADRDIERKNRPSPYDIDLHEKHEILSLNISALECQLEMINTQLEKAQRQVLKVNDFKRINVGNSLKELTTEDINAQLHKIISKLIRTAKKSRTISLPLESLSIISRFQKELDNIKIEHEKSYGSFLSRYHVLNNFQKYRIYFDSLDQYRIRDLADEDFSDKFKKDVVHTKRSKILDDVRRRLNKLEEQRTIELKNITTFLTDLNQREKSFMKL